MAKTMTIKELRKKVCPTCLFARGCVLDECARLTPEKTPKAKPKVSKYGPEVNVKCLECGAWLVRTPSKYIVCPKCQGKLKAWSALPREGQ